MSTNNIKFCPKCSAQHQQLGKFCCRSCANSRGPRTSNFKLNVSAKLSGKPSHSKDKILVKRVEIPCFVCYTLLTTTEKEIQRRKKMTCSSVDCIRESKSLAGKASAAKRVKRSKDEIKLFEMCKHVFDDVQSNLIVANGWDADIVIGSCKLAILWHGPWHYRDMKMNNHSLKQVQMRDEIKRNLFTSLGWKVLEFKDCDYTPEKAFEEILIEDRGYAPLP
jgi:hypothetical protein